MKKTFVGAVVIALITIFSLSNSYAVGNIEVTRIQGRDRYQTAVEISKHTFNRSHYAIVASGENYPDALIGGSLAVQLKSPVLLTSKNRISENTLNEIKRLNVKEVFLLGGNAAVSSSVESSLRKITKVERIAGPNRYETAEKINNKRYDLRPDQQEYAMGDVIYYVSGTNYPDALAAAPLFGQVFPEYNGIQAYLGLALPKVDVAPFTAIGGPSAVYHSYDSNPPEYYEPSDYDYRIFGNNRYGTAVELAKRYPEFINKNIDTIVLTNGTNYPDALAAAPLTGSRNAALLLTRPDSLPSETKNFIKSKNIKKVIIVGGEKSVSNNVVKELVN